MYYRKIRTYQEKRFNARDSQYVRGRRQPHVLRDAWDDIQNTWSFKLSWKSRTRKEKSWLRGKLKHKWWFLKEILDKESEMVDDFHRWPDRKFGTFYKRWDLYWEISEKDLRAD